jgi:hypothetical protein
MGEHLEIIRKFEHQLEELLILYDSGAKRST